MRHLRPFTVLLAMAALITACSSSSSSGGESQGSEPSTGSQPSQAAASTGGGGGGGGANGSITYEITGDYEASGELPFVAGSTWIESSGGWVANFADPAGGGSVILLNTQEGQTIGQSLTYGDGSVTVIVTSDAGSGMDCTFTLDKNDADGLKGHVECTSAFGVDNNTGARKNVQLTAQWDAHP